MAKHFREYVRNGFSPEEMERLWDTNPAKVAAPPPWDGYTFLEDGDVLTYGEDACVACSPRGIHRGICVFMMGSPGGCSAEITYSSTLLPISCRWDGVEDSLGDYLQSLERVRA